MIFSCVGFVLLISTISFGSWSYWKEENGKIYNFIHIQSRFSFSELFIFKSSLFIIYIYSKNRNRNFEPLFSRLHRVSPTTLTLRPHLRKNNYHSLHYLFNKCFTTNVKKIVILAIK